MPHFQSFLSPAEGIEFPALLQGPAATSLALQAQLNESQWWDQQNITKQQLKQLSHLLAYSYNNVPFYRKSFDANNWIPTQLATLKDLQQIPVLSRKELQNAGHLITSNATPQDHGRLFDTTTSGSTGMPVKLKRSIYVNQIWDGLILREHNWYQRDLTSEHCTIKYAPKGTWEAPFGHIQKGWGSASSLLYENGIASYLNSSASIDTQAKWLKHRNPKYLFIYPTNLQALAKEVIKQNLKLTNLKQIRTNGEAYPDGLRELCQEAFGQVDIADIYGTLEVGFIAFQCPEHKKYHIQSENVLVEILDEKNQPCPQGKIGKVVITSLNNYATPLIRYEIGDYASFGEQCECGRGLPVLEKIFGRTRNMLKLPDGSSHWPTFGYRNYEDIAPIEQFQIIQKSLDELEVRLVVPNKLSNQQENSLSKVIQESMRYPFTIRYTYMDNIPRSASNKFEEFMSEIL